MDRQRRELALCKMQERAKERETSCNCNKYAAGGAAKVRKDVATKSGQVVKTHRNMGRSGK